MKYVSFLHVQNVIPYVQMFYIITITLTSNERRCVSNQWQLECLFQQIVETRNKGVVKDPHYWPFVRGIHQCPVDSPHLQANTTGRISM